MTNADANPQDTTAAIRAALASGNVLVISPEDMRAWLSYLLTENGRLTKQRDYGWSLYQEIDRITNMKLNEFYRIHGHDADYNKWLSLQVDAALTDYVQALKTIEDNRAEG